MELLRTALTVGRDDRVPVFVLLLELVALVLAVVVLDKGGDAVEERVRGIEIVAMPECVPVFVVVPLCVGSRATLLSCRSIIGSILISMYGSQ